MREILEQRLFTKEQLDIGLEILVRKEKGYLDDLISEFKSEKDKLKIKNEEEIKKLIDILYLLGYIKFGISRKKCKISFRTTIKAYKEILPLWKLILKSIGIK